MSNKIVLNKIFIECRYPNNLLFNDMSKLSTIYRNSIDIFDNYDYDKNNHVLLLNNNQKLISASVLENRFVFDMNEPKTPENFKNYASKFVNVVSNILDIDYFNRVGIRSYWGIEYESYEFANRKIMETFFKLSREQLKIFGEDINSSKIGFTTNIDDFKAHFQISPNNIRIVDIINNDIKRNIDRKELTLDIDIFKDYRTDADSVNNILKRAVETSKNKAELAYKVIEG